MTTFSNAEYADILFMYGKANEPGVTYTTYATDVDEQILEAFEADPTTSIRTIAHRFNVSIWKVWSVLNAEGKHPFRYTSVQALEEGDPQRRTLFCRFLLNADMEDRLFLRRILWTNESKFSHEGITNFHNLHYWSDAVENPHVKRQTSFQRKFSVNVWAGVIGKILIGPYYLPDNLNGDNYLVFLKNVMPDILDEMPLNVRNMKDLVYAEEIRDKNHLINAFIRGLPDELARAVEARDPDNLEKALEIAIKVEERMNTGVIPSYEHHKPFQTSDTRHNYRSHGNYRTDSYREYSNDSHHNAYTPSYPYQSREYQNYPVQNENRSRTPSPYRSFRYPHSHQNCCCRHNKPVQHSCCHLSNISSCCSNPHSTHTSFMDTKSHRQENVELKSRSSSPNRNISFSATSANQPSVVRRRSPSPHSVKPNLGKSEN
ncbi:hypothetical protein ANTQUA_LOCUS2981, partial [Anthophora quadrimaculata]